MPFPNYGYQQTSPSRHRGYSRPAAYDFTKISSRSQPARRRSYSSSSSDSEAAAEISARLLKSSDDPQELRRIMKETRKRPRKPKEASPKVSVRDRRSNSSVDNSFEKVPRPSKHSKHIKPAKREKKRHRAEPRRSMSPFIAHDLDDEIPAARDTDYFNDNLVQSPVRKQRRESKEKRPAKQPSRSEAVTRSQPTAMVPYVPREHRPRLTQRDQIGERTQEYWNPSTIQTGKRQRLPRLDWRKGERYLRAPDGTIIGKQGYSNLVCDDGFGNLGKRTGPKRSTEKARVSVSTEVEEREVVVAKPTKEKTSNRPSRRESVPSTREAIAEEERPLLNAYDFLEKDDDGVYCLGRHRLLHRAADRKWGDSVEQGGFRLCPSISTKDAYIAEIALEPGKAEERAPETLQANQVIYGRVLQAAPNSVRLQIMGKSDERLSDEDEFYIDAGSRYLITNLSQEKAAVLSLVAFE